MNRKTALALLQHHRAELVGLGVVTFSIIGSTAREEASASSDVDVAVRLTEGERGFAHFRRMDHLKKRLAETLGGQSM
jgi:predicted nucleotidyltransferase